MGEPELPSDSPWLAVTPANGSDTAEPDSLSVSVDATGLAEGTYVGSITPSAPGAETTVTADATGMAFLP